MTNVSLAPIVTRKSLSNTYEYAGGTIAILLSGADTGGDFSMWEGYQKPGGEPPLHVHHTTDETFIVLEGDLRFLVGDRIVDAPAGSVVFAPRGIPHTFKIKSPRARAITIATPAGFEEWFRQMGRPATSFDLPERVDPPTQEEIHKMIALGKSLQTDIIRPVDF
jgi:mannose-6-phosphate isomerase-like protein (cupin superfamily)